MFFDPRRYDLAKVGRYKFNKKLALKNRIAGFALAEDVIDTSTGEILAEAGTVVDKELADKIQNAAVQSVVIQTETGNTKVLSNMTVNLAEYVAFNPEEIGVHENVFYPVLEKILEEGYEGASTCPRDKSPFTVFRDLSRTFSRRKERRASSRSTVSSRLFSIRSPPFPLTRSRSDAPAGSWCP